MSRGWGVEAPRRRQLPPPTLTLPLKGGGDNNASRPRGVGFLTMAHSIRLGLDVPVPTQVTRSGPGHPGADEDSLQMIGVALSRPTAGRSDARRS